MTELITLPLSTGSLTVQVHSVRYPVRDRRVSVVRRVVLRWIGR